MPALFVYCWTVYYNSDYAMIGLMARGVLHHGERPIHVWTVGYQGILFEVYAVAAAFKLWGESPRVLHLVPWAVFLIFLGFYYRSVKESLGTRLASLALLFVLISTPTVYGLVLRTQPNYGEVFVLGTALMLAYSWFLRRHYVEGRHWDRRSWAGCALMGFLCGFGMYTYGQMAFFIAAVGCHGLMVLAREASMPLLKPWPLALAAAVVLFGALSWVTGIHRIEVGALRVGWEPFSTLRFAVKLWALALMLKVCWIARSQLKARRKILVLASLAFIMGALTGFAPELYARLVLKVWTYDRSRMGVGFGEFLTHMRWAAQALAQFFNAGLTPGIVPDFWGDPRPWVPKALTAPLALFWALAALGGAALMVSTAAAFIRGRVGKSAVLSLSPLVFLPLPVLLSFGLAPTVMGYPNTRYLTVMLLAVALYSAHFVMWVLDRGRRSQIRAVWAVVLLVFLNNGAAIGAKLAQHRTPHPLEDVAAYLEGRSVERGYAGFWEAYALTFLAKEKIILEPTESNLNPRYGPLVLAARRVAFVAPEGAPFPLGNRFKIQEQAPVNGFSVMILERQK